MQGLIKSGHVAADGLALNCHTTVKRGLTVRVRVPPPEPIGLEPEDIPLDILFEDADIVAVNKPAGLVVHPAPGHPRGTLVHALLHHCRDLAGVGDVLRPGIVHRLDRDTSGIILVAKNDPAMDGLARQFQERTLTKRYVVLVHGVPRDAEGRIETLIGRSRHDRKKMSVHPPSGRQAITFYSVRERYGDAVLLDVRIATGRTHQIRVHMAHLRCPVIGDPVYGDARRDAALPVASARQMLHAAHITFTHPRKGKTLALDAPWPDDLVAVRDALRQES